MRRELALPMIVLALLGACTNGKVATTGPAPKPTTTVAVPSPSASPLPPTSPSPKPIPPKFFGSVSPLPGALVAEMKGTTWHQGCPVGLDDLRLLSLRYWGFDGQVHQGPMVINAAVAHKIVFVFRRLFQAHFPIYNLHLARKYVPGHDDPTDRSDFSAGFNCRPAVTARGPRSNWSQHAYGLAIDVNPMQNPYVTYDGYIRNYHARHYRDRSLQKLGMIHDGDAVVRAFAAIGWYWGGHWDGDKDYMHFSWNGH